jgi:hypothetical protein
VPHEAKRAAAQSGNIHATIPSAATTGVLGSKGISR